MSGIMMARCVVLYLGLLTASWVGWTRWFMASGPAAITVFMLCLMHFMHRFALVV